MFHKHIALRLRDKLPLFQGDVIAKNKVRVILCRSHIPRKIHDPFLKEMESIGYVKLINRSSLKVNEDKINLIKIEEMKDESKKE